MLAQGGVSLPLHRFAAPAQADHVVRCVLMMVRQSMLGTMLSYLLDLSKLKPTCAQKSLH
jgi:hypothetical protein